jgi:hypothetical protein
MPSFPKPPKRQRTPRKPLARRTRVRKASSKQRAKIKERTEVTRPFVLADDDNACRACFARPQINYRGWLEVNEHPSKALGGDMTNPAHCITLCANTKGNGCHQKYTAGKLKIQVIDQERGCRAPVEFTEGDKTWLG